MTNPPSLSDPTDNSDRLTVFFNENHDKLYRYVCNKLRNEGYTKSLSADADDICGKTWEILSGLPRVVDTHPNPIGWLFATANNQFKQYRDEKIKRGQLSLDEITEAEREPPGLGKRDVVTVEDAECAALMIAVQRLPDAAREAVMLKFFWTTKKEAKSDSERQALSRGLIKLREILSDELNKSS